jgi:hypothetical protein
MGTLNVHNGYFGAPEAVVAAYRGRYHKKLGHLCLVGLGSQYPKGVWSRSWILGLRARLPRRYNYYFERNTELLDDELELVRLGFGFGQELRHCGQHCDNKHSFHFAERAP